MKKICIGKIADAHGIKGLIKVLFFDFVPDASTTTFFTDEDGDNQIQITLKNKNGKYYLAEIDGLADRNGAEALKGTKLHIDANEIEADETEVFIGFAVLDGAGETIGSIIGIDDFGASPLLSIKPKAGADFYVPLADQFITEIDEESKTITIADIDLFRE